MLALQKDSKDSFTAGLTRISQILVKQGTQEYYAILQRRKENLKEREKQIIKMILSKLSQKLCAKKEKKDLEKVRAIIRTLAPFRRSTEIIVKYLLGSPDVSHYEEDIKTEVLPSLQN
jgi:DNA-binding CsgD family transcriptional regulator